MPISPLIVDAVVKAVLPPGWRVHFSSRPAKDCDGHCNFEKKLIRVKPIKNHYDLGVFIHEAVHAHTHDVDNEKRPPKHIMEYQAERFAMKFMREHGLTVSREYLRFAKENVATQVVSDRNSGISIDPRVKRWLGKLI
jgi:hypothetical protein